MNDRTVSMLESYKEDFYRSGGFLKVSEVEGAREGLRSLRTRGWKIITISARPYWQYKRVYGDTLKWLKDHQMSYDLILFNKDKAEAIYEHIFPARPAFVIEDREKHAKEVAKIGVSVLLYSNPGNLHVGETKLIKRVESWSEIVEIIGWPESER